MLLLHKHKTNRSKTCLTVKIFFWLILLNIDLSAFFDAIPEHFGLWASSRSGKDVAMTTLTSVQSLEGVAYFILKIF